MSHETPSPPLSRFPRLAIALDVTSYLAAPLVYVAATASGLPYRVIRYCEPTRPDHPVPYVLAEPYGALLALVTVSLVAGLVALRLVLSRRRFYVPLPAIAVALVFARAIQWAFIFG